MFMIIIVGSSNTQRNTLILSHSLGDTPQVAEWPCVAVELVDAVTGGDSCLHRHPHLLPVRQHTAPALLHCP